LAASSSGSRGRHFSPGIRNGPQQPGQRQTMPVSRGAPHTPLCRFERGVVGVTFHDLRATAVTRLAAPRRRLPLSPATRRGACARYSTRITLRVIRRLARAPSASSKREQNLPTDLRRSRSKTGDALKYQMAALPGYLSNYVPRPGTRFSADFGGYPRVALCRLGTKVRFAGQGARRNGPAPPVCIRGQYVPRCV
jgi:hypothetical protein